MPNRHMFPTSLKDVQPGNETGDYHITFCNLAFNTTWQEMKDWISASCPVDYIEVFPSSCSGWIRVKGKDNFEKALAHLRSERFKDRSLLFDSRNEIEAIKIKCKETSPKPKHARRKRSTRGPKMLCEKSPAPEDRRAQSPPPYTHTWSPTDHVHAAEVAERRAYEEYLAFASLMFSTTSLQGALQMQYPVSAFPYYQAEYFNGMGMDYYGNRFPAYSFGASPDIHPAQVASGSALPRGLDDMPDVPVSWLEYRSW